MSDEDKTTAPIRIKVIETDPSGTELKPEVEEVKPEEIKPVINEPVIEHKIEKPLETEKIESHLPKKDNVSFFALFVAFLFGLFFGAGVIGGLFYFNSKITKTKPVANNNLLPTIEPETTPSPSVSPSVSPSTTKSDYSKYKVQILNGSGISGEANKAKALMITNGFKDIETTNASRYDYLETEVSLKSGLEESLLPYLKATLSNLVVKEGSVLPATSKYDIVITVGKTRK